MVPNLSSPGHSFQGAYKYHTHDKGEPDTNDRVDWHTTRGLMTDDLDTAERIMIATAYDADRLKEQAGIKATGRKSTKHVQTLSLAWHPDEQVDRPEMERAAEAALKELGLENHQAVIIAHNDTEHQHIHIIVNRVDPNDGRLATLSNSKRKLDRWAHGYEKSRGRIVTPNRAEKYDRQKEASQRHSPDERRTYAEKKRAEASQRRPNNPRAELARLQQHVRQRHSAEWKDLNARHREQRQWDYQAYRERFKQTKEQHDNVAQSNKATRRAEWGAIYKHHQDSAAQRKRMGRSPTGRLALAVIAAQEEKREGSQESFARLTIANFISTARRERAFEIAGNRDKASLAERQNFGRNKAFQHIKARRAEEIQSRRTQQTEDRNELKSKQEREKGTIRREWAELNTERQGYDARRNPNVRNNDAANRLSKIREDRELTQQPDRKISVAERLSEIRKEARTQESSEARNRKKDRDRDDDLGR